MMITRVLGFRVHRVPRKFVLAYSTTIKYTLVVGAGTGARAQPMPHQRIDPTEGATQPPRGSIRSRNSYQLSVLGA